MLWEIISDLSSDSTWQSQGSYEILFWYIKDCRSYETNVPFFNYCLEHLLEFVLKGLCREQKFIAAINCLHQFFITWGLNVLSLNVITPDTIVSVIWIKKTYYKSHISTSLLAGLPLIFNVYILPT